MNGTSAHDQEYDDSRNGKAGPSAIAATAPLSGMTSRDASASADPSPHIATASHAPVQIPFPSRSAQQWSPDGIQKHSTLNPAASPSTSPALSAPEGGVSANGVAGPSTLRPVKISGPKRMPQMLSLSIPPGSEAYGGLTPSSSNLSSTAPLSSITGPTDVPLSAISPSMSSAFPSASSSHGMRIPKANNRRRPARLDLAVAPSSPSETRRGANLEAAPDAAPSSSSSPSDLPPSAGFSPPSQLADIEEQEKYELRQALTGRPRRRPSMPFAYSVPAHEFLTSARVHTPGLPSANRTPEVWRDPSEHILSGKGSTLQHARSVYATGLIEVLPGLYLGDEHNARDNAMLEEYQISTILNVSRETVLPFQNDQNATPLRARRSRFRSSNHPEGLLGLAEEQYSVKSRTHTLDLPSDAYTSRSAPRTPAGVSQKPASETLLEESEEADADAALTSSPQALRPVAEGPSTSHLLRNTLSTPNLQQEFTLTAKEPTPKSALNGAQDFTTNISPGVSEMSKFSLSSSGSSTAPLSDVTSLSSVADGSAEGAEDAAIRAKGGESLESLLTTCDVELPDDAVRLTIPASPSSGRPQAVRYIKLPWTHDQTELATQRGGFPQGCAVIAEALGIDHYGRPQLDPTSGTPRPPGNILVHCQCGVSRSATLVIAFVMQAAALNYSFEATKKLTGMHDCYNLVKNLSSSISPNISLIYQLVEWERHLSAEAARLRAALLRQRQMTLDNSRGVSSVEGELHDIIEEGMAPAATGWSAEAQDEEEWMRMRLEEERKEQDEQEKRRKTIEQEAKRQAEERRKREQEAASAAGAAVTNGDSPMAAAAGTGIGARRRKMAPSLSLTSKAPLDDSANQPLPSASLTGSFAIRPTLASRRGETEGSLRPLPTLSVTRKLQSLNETGGAAVSTRPDPEPALEEEGERTAVPSAGESSVDVDPSVGLSSLRINSSVETAKKGPFSFSSVPLRPSLAPLGYGIQSSSHPSSSSTSSPRTNPAPRADFGLLSGKGLTALERKERHRRTFSSEVVNAASTTGTGGMMAREGSGLSHGHGHGIAE